MKLDVALSQVGVPTAAPYQQASPERFGQGAGAVAQLGQTGEVGAERFAHTIRAAEEARKEQAIRTDAARIRSRFELDAHEFDADLRTTVSDPDEYYTKLKDGLQQRYQAIADLGTKHPETMALLTPQLERAIAERSAAALSHRITLTKSSENGKIDETVRNLLQRARQVPLGDHAAWAGVGNEIQGAIANGLPVNGADATGDAQDKAMGSFFGDRAAAHMRADPDGFQRDGAKLYGGILGANKLLELDESAGRRIEARARDEDRRRKELETATEHQVKKIQGATAIEARTRYDDGALTDEWLRDAGDGGWLTPEKFEHYSELLRKPPKEMPLDPEIAARLVPEVYSVSRNPAQMSETWGKVSSYIRSGVLPATGAPKEWLAHLESRISRAEDQATTAADKTLAKTERLADKLERERERDDTRKRAGLNAAHRQAEQLMGVDLRTTGPLEALTKEGRTVYGQALTDLSRESGAEGMQGNQNPLDWWQKNKPRYMARVRDVAAARIEFLRGATGGYQSVGDLRRARAKMNDEEYYNRLDALKEIDSLTREAASINDAIKSVGPVK